MTAYYNEFDPKAAAWLRELIRQGHIADGVVDGRDLWDATPDELRGFTQVHLCAGVGVWSYALRRAGWPDDRPVWTGSFPCQPFSAAGKGGGFTDERHLWPAGNHLIAECRPPVVFGEQVASKDAEPWIDLVQVDLEAVGYALGAVPFPAAGVGAPHIRDRLYWVADTAAERLSAGAREQGLRHGAGQPERPDGAGRLGDDDDEGLEGQRSRHQAEGRRVGALRPVAEAGKPGGLGHSERLSAGRDTGAGLGAQGGNGGGHVGDDARPSGAVVGLAEHKGLDGRAGLRDPRSTGHGLPLARDDSAVRDLRPTGPVNGLWRAADWLFCRDGKWRPVEPGTFPLAHGAAERVGRLRGYGNAIVAPAAQAFIEAYLEAEEDRHLRLIDTSAMTTDILG